MMYMISFINTLAILKSLSIRPLELPLSPHRFLAEITGFRSAT
jgi:hypothetical protein